MENNNLATKENDKTGSIINPRRLTMTLEIHMIKRMAKLLFDWSTSKSHDRYFSKDKNIKKYLSTSLNEDTSSITNKGTKVFIEKMCIPFKTKISDLEEALLITDKYLESIFIRDMVGSTFTILNDIKQDKLLTCEIKVSGMTVGLVDVQAGVIYRFNPVSNQREEKIFESNIVKDLCTGDSQKKNRIVDALNDLTTVSEEYFKQLNEIYINYYDMLLKNFARDEGVMLCLESYRKKYAANNSELTDYIEEVKNSAYNSTRTWKTNYFSFSETPISKKQIFKNLNINDENKDKTIRTLSFLSTLKSSSKLELENEKIISIYDCLQQIAKQESTHNLIEIKEITLSAENDIANISSADDIKRYRASLAAETKYVVGMMILSGKAFSVVQSKSLQLSTSTLFGSCYSEESDSEKEINSQSLKNSILTDKYTKRQSMLLIHSKPLSVFELLDYSRQIASKILMMTDSYVEMLNKSKNLICFERVFKDTLKKYEIDEKEFIQQFLSF